MVLNKYLNENAALRIIEFIADILVNFPLASDLFLKKPPSRKITNIFGIYPLMEGHMC